MVSRPGYQNYSLPPTKRRLEGEVGHECGARRSANRSHANTSSIDGWRHRLARPDCFFHYKGMSNGNGFLGRLGRVSNKHHVFVRLLASAHPHITPYLERRPPPRGEHQLIRSDASQNALPHQPGAAAQCGLSFCADAQKILRRGFHVSRQYNSTTGVYAAM